MRYTLVLTEEFEKQFRKLDRSVQTIVVKWIRKHLEDCEDPRASGKALSANLKGYWRYRIGDYRLLVEIRDEELIIVAISIAHRSDVYNQD
ncbi:MAG: type II toxin-antitoxin system RelE/ParE family toxin [Lachnospiraceae bacterium]|nr:type II toxin-antitoxin system RelE/ParE family toxin [Lachnospiraceae bacterium]